MKLSLLGRKLGHSLSPQIHAAIFRYLGIEGSYGLTEVEPEELEERFAEFPEEFQGMNVTIPYKVAVMPYLNYISDEAKGIGAVNTILFSPAGNQGYNTDYFGFGKMLEHNNIVVAHKDAVVLGNGGGAKAVIQQLLDSKARKITVVMRNLEKGKKKLENMLKYSQIEFVTYDKLNSLHGEIIVNCTPVGMYPNVHESIVTTEQMKNFKAAVDLVYNPEETMFLKHAREAGCMGCNGLYMLVAQAVAAEEVWLNRKLPEDLIIQISKEMQGVLHG